MGNIAAALNNHFSNWDTFGIFHDTSTGSLLIDTQAIVGEYGHEYVQNVATGALDFWNGHNLHHYDGVYGWTQTQVDVSEEWNPIKIYGSSSYGNPFGEHAEALSKDLTAINTSPSGQFVG